MTRNAIGIAFALGCLLTAPATAQQPSTTGTAVRSSAVADPRPTPAGAARAVGAPALPKEYRLGTGDKLRIEVYRDTQLSGPVQIRPDGKITMPLIGDIAASGQTPLELRDAITNALREYVNNPTVSVVVVEATAATAFIFGEVNRPGPVSLSGNTTVLQALSMAGGFTTWAKTKKIRILRAGPTGTTAIPFDYDGAIEGFGAPVYLNQGDTVVVPD